MHGIKHQNFYLDMWRLTFESVGTYILYVECEFNTCMKFHSLKQATSYM